MTVKQHLEKMHVAAATHHKALAANETKKAEYHNSLADSHDELDQPEVAKLHRKCAKACEAAAEEHSSYAASHGEMTKSITDEMNKNAGDGAGPRLSGIMTHFPIPVARPGAPDLSKANVPEEFKHLIAIEE